MAFSPAFFQIGKPAQGWSLVLNYFSREGVQLLRGEKCFH
jgi:hypothetical protein